MGHVEVGHLTYVLPDGRPLLNDVSFRIGDGVKAALVGPNGAGKTTLMRLVAGDLQPIEGSVASSGGLGLMALLCGIFVALCVRSFITARRDRLAAAGPSASNRV